MKKDEQTGVAQRNRFEQAARELGVDLDEEKLKEALREIGNSRTVEHKDAESDKGNP